MKIRAIYDNGGKTLDRITVVVNQKNNDNSWDCLCLSHNGVAFSQWSTCQQGRHLGKKVSFEELSPELQKHIESRLK